MFSNKMLDMELNDNLWTYGKHNLVFYEMKVLKLLIGRAFYSGL